MMRRVLPEASEDHQRLIEHFARTGRQPCRDRFGESGRVARKALEVTCIERVFLPVLAERYHSCAKDIYDQRGSQSGTLIDGTALKSDSCVGSNEVLLYHGCHPDSLQDILREGFDATRGGERNGSLFGKGTYFTDCAAKADKYTRGPPEDQQHRFVIVAQVCLGKVLVAKKAAPLLDRWPVHGGACPGHVRDDTFDSVLGEDSAHGGLLDYREYVVFRGAQCLPCYLLWYRHGLACECFRCRAAVLSPVAPVALYASTHEEADGTSPHADESGAQDCHPSFPSLVLPTRASLRLPVRIPSRLVHGRLPNGLLLESERTRESSEKGSNTVASCSLSIAEGCSSSFASPMLPKGAVRESRALRAVVPLAALRTRRSYKIGSGF